MPSSYSASFLFIFFFSFFFFGILQKLYFPLFKHCTVLELDSLQLLTQCCYRTHFIPASLFHLKFTKSSQSPFSSFHFSFCYSYAITNTSFSYASSILIYFSIFFCLIFHSELFLGISWNKAQEKFVKWQQNWEMSSRHLTSSANAKIPSLVNSN